MIRAHPMCAELNEDAHRRGYLYVTYPAGDFPVEGLRVSKANGKRVALARALDVMERHWRESFPGYVNPSAPCSPA